MFTFALHEFRVALVSKSQHIQERDHMKYTLTSSEMRTLDRVLSFECYVNWAQVLIFDLHENVLVLDTEDKLYEMIETIDFYGLPFLDPNTTLYKFLSKLDT